MSGGPPTQSEIDYASPLERVRKPEGARRPWLAVVLIIVAAIAFGCVWGLQS